jgi:hypothetical protein
MSQMVAEPVSVSPVYRTELHSSQGGKLLTILSAADVSDLPGIMPGEHAFLLYMMDDRGWVVQVCGPVRDVHSMLHRNQFHLKDLEKEMAKPPMINTFKWAAVRFKLIPEELRNLIKLHAPKGAI